MSEVSLHERLAVLVARTLRADDVGFTGLTTGGPTAMFGTYIPVAAMQLARLTHAPDLTLFMAGWCHNPSLRDLGALPRSEFPLSWYDVPSEARKDTWPGIHSMYRSDVTVGFCSAAQIDRVGSVNTVRIDRPDGSHVRLVGPVMVTEHMAFYGREIVMMPRHDRRTFVERVDYVSAVGHPGGKAGRAEMQVPGSGPALVVTPLGVLDFDDVTGVMRLRYVHPGVSVERVREETGFDLDCAAALPTPDPTADELAVLREQVDPQGFLRAGVPA
ncbi:CoA-transferase subunit beta [Pseudonocardia ailaonensis]|uniref:CoA-transferase subunit beta n=1 Tax=Pseudonocardia ailaonensis TaxID=367279 RepID=A0ABN2MZR3_9PSEU